MCIYWPSHEELEKLSGILSTWDEALTQLDALIEAQERRKKALMQQLLTGKKRFPSFKVKWKTVALGDVAENVADQNKGRMGTTSLYGVTKAEGVVPMREHVKGVSFDRCKRVETDWFAYNPMRINIGSIARWQGTETVMVSGDYVVFRCHPDKLLPAYLEHLRQSWMWQSFVTRGGNGSVRIRIYFSDLAEFTFPCPPIEEQRQIAAILDTADQQLTLLRNHRTALEQQKRGLMQRLLTGKIRINAS
ncbi:MAG: restriction endonuclease subunit S [Verrucomicrobiales bacterium]|nr:restriction endonuclease subunit S [Verrucomicrobiales bacterium]